MTDTLNDRLRQVRARWAQALRRGRRAAAAPARALAGGLARGPTQLLVAPPDLRTVDPTVASDIYAGYFVFAGRSVAVGGRSPFEVPAPSRAWAETLHGFGWLRHLRGADTELARSNARALLDEWADASRRARTEPRRDGAAEGSVEAEDEADPRWHPRVAARRLIALLAHSPFLLADAPPPRYRAFLRLLRRHVLALRAELAAPASATDALFCAVALAHYAASVDGSARERDRAFRTLGEMLSRQILPDGGHVSRDPSVLIALMLDLLPLRQALSARGLPLPEPLVAALERIPPMVRLFRHRDGALALFNGMGTTPLGHVATLLSYGNAGRRAIEAASPSGYHRLSAGRSVVVADVGPPPPMAESGRAGAGCLSFEMSSGRSRIVVNCGLPLGGPEARRFARSTAAHSTLQLGEASSARFTADGAEAPLVTGGPAVLDIARENDGDGLRLSAAHDGWGARHGLIHRRSLHLSRGGDRLEGEDRLERADPRRRRPPEAGLDFAVRFHLHPSVTAEATGEREARVVQPDGVVWRFTVEEGEVRLGLEDSVFFAAARGPRPTRQIVLSGSTGAEAEGVVARLRWRFACEGLDGADGAEGFAERRRLAGRAGETDDDADAERDPADDVALALPPPDRV